MASEVRPCLSEDIGRVISEETNLDSSLQVGSQIIIHRPGTLSENLGDLLFREVAIVVRTVAAPGPGAEVGKG